MNKIPVWIDTDCGVDDALAILCALKMEELEIVGLSSGAGAASHKHTFANVRNILKLAGREDLKVYPGADKAWIEEYRPAPEFHGENGIGDVILEESDVPKESLPAWDAMYQKARELKGELTVATMGQLTNLATAIVKYPDFTGYVKQFSIMGGAIQGGNMTPCAEANIRRDPHAAQCVFRSGVPIRMFGLDVTEKAYLSADELNTLKENKINDFIKQSNKRSMKANKEQGRGEIAYMHDLCPLLELAHPELFTSKEAGVYVETRSPMTMGKTISDLYVLADHLFDTKNARVFLDIDREKANKIVIDILNSY